MRGPRIAIVTPWHEHRELWNGYRQAVEPELQEGDELLIVDNGSSPPLEFATIYSEQNLGFSTGCNVGLRSAQAAAVLFLNNDVELQRGGWLGEIREAIEEGVLVGPLRNGAHADVDGRPYPYLDGWCLAGMRSDLLGLGGFDESLAEPAYFSDNLLCLEARARGMTLRDLRPGLRHLENVTAGRAVEPQVRAATSENHARYVARVRELTS